MRDVGSLRLIMRFSKLLLLIIPAATLTAWLLPHDLLRNPPFAGIPKAPRNPEIISCYSVMKVGAEEEGPFWGKSSFGNFWSWRRHLDKLDGRHIGPRQQDVEGLWDMSGPLNVLVYRQADRITALLYSKIPSPNSGSLGGYIRLYSRKIDESWQMTEEHWDTITDISIFVEKVILAAWVGGGTSIVVLAIFLSSYFRNRRANHGLAGNGGVPR